MEEKVLERVDKLETELNNVKTRLAVAERDIQTVMNILEKINQNTTWILRLIIGFIVTLVLGLLFTGGGTL